MAKGHITVGVKLLSEQSTEVICRATDCLHNMAHDPVSPYAGCRMKAIYLIKGGKCEQYEKDDHRERFTKHSMSESGKTINLTSVEGYNNR